VFGREGAGALFPNRTPTVAVTEQMSG